jgi:hypothetical protein
MRLRSTVSLAFVLMALTNSCTSESTEPTGDPSTLSFTYSGYRNGAYTVTGFQPDPRTGLLNKTPWAGAVNFAIADQTFTEIVGSLPAGANIHVVEFIVPAAATGTFSLGAAHSGFVYDLLTFELDPNSGAGEQYALSPGTVTVTSTSANHVVGTFSGTAVDSTKTRSINITNGSFNVYVPPQ